MLAHNKTLAAQLFHEFKCFFPQNAVEYFVSYYDYYQPEAYIPASDTYIEKESTINDELDKLRMSATRSLFERRDVIIVASVSCIYGMGSPEAYYGMMLHARKGPDHRPRSHCCASWWKFSTSASEDLRRGTFRVRGDMHRNLSALRGPRLAQSNCGARRSKPSARSTRSPEKSRSAQTISTRLPIYPKTHYVMPAEQRERAIQTHLRRARLVEARARKAGQNRGGAARRGSARCSISR